MKNIIGQRKNYYQVELLDINNNIKRFWMRHNWIFRKLTKDEIEDFEMRLNSSKYNL